MRKWQRGNWSGVGTLALGLALGMCCGAVAQSAEPSGTLVVAWDGAPENWAPGADNPDGFMRVAYETLVQRTAESGNEFNPMLATEWEVTEEKVTLKLREGVKFHDGTDFNAAAVKASLEYVKNDAGPFSGYLASIESINVVDDTTVELMLSEPDPAILIALASRAGLMGSPAAIADGSIKNAPVGTGPWRFNAEESTAGTRWVFDYFPDYYDPSQVKLERIEVVGLSDPAARFAAVQSGEVHVTELDASLIQQAEGMGYDTQIVPGTHIGVLMVDRGPGGKLENVETRQAVCSGVDTEAFGMVGGPNARTMVSQRFPAGEYGHNPEITGWTLNPELASKASGLNIDIGIFDGAAEDAEALAGELARHGINLDVQIVPAARYFADWYKDWDIAIGDNTELHPALWYKTWFAAGAPNNASGVESPALKAAADAAIAAGTSPEAEALWQNVMKIIHDEALICMHFDFNFVGVWNPEKVKNVVMYPYMIATVDYRTIEVAE